MRLCRAAAGAVSVLLVAGCGGGTTTVTVTVGGQSTAATADSTASGSPSTRPELLFAVVEAHSGRPSQAGYVDDTVAIVGLDGVARSKATFAPRTPPTIGNAAPIMQPDARVAAGRVFYIDGRGEVRSLGPVHGALPVMVTTFAPPRPQGYVSFAVSPDGRHLMAAVDTLTAFQPSTSTDNPFGSGADQDHDTIEAADAGGQARTLYTMDRPAKPLFIGGWDATSPLGILDPHLGTQSGIPPGWSSPVARLDAGGRPGARLGPASCVAVQSLPDGTVLCLDSESGGTTTGGMSVHGPSVGTWTIAPVGDSVPFGGYGEGPQLSPDGRTVVFLGSQPGSSVASMYAMTKGGRVRRLVDNFTPEGFLDADTVIGAMLGDNGAADMAVVRLSGGGVDDLGFRGVFVGVVQPGG